MSVYLVSYDFRAPRKDYAPLHAHLKTYAWAKPLESLWFIKTDLSAKALGTAVANHMDGDDKLVVVDVGSDAAWKNIPNDVASWIQKNL